jgi:hypothetical protein
LKSCRHSVSHNPYPWIQVPIYIFSKGSLKRANRGHRAFSSQVDTVLEKDKASVAFYAFSKIIFCPVLSDSLHDRCPDAVFGQLATASLSILEDRHD